MSTLDDNPYAAPHADGAISAEPALEFDYRAVLRRWELLRVLYNVVVALAGVLPLVASLSKYGPWATVANVLMYAAAANVCYSFGPLVELYLNWLTDVAKRMSWPRLPTGFVRSYAPTVLLFVFGAVISVFLTLWGGLVLLWNT